MTTNKNSGFTLIELLVIATIGVLITIAAVNMFFTVILSGSKANALNEVKQNGDYAITQIERIIRSSVAIISACSSTSNSSSLVLDNGDGTTTTISSSPSYLNSPVQILINEEPITSGYQISAVVPISFNCHISSGSAPTLVDYSFTLQKGEVDIDRPSDIVNTTFHGRAQLRQY